LSEALRETSWFEPEEAEVLAIGGASLLVGELYNESAVFRVLSWSVGLLVGVVNGLSFGAILGWLAARVDSGGSLRARILILSVLGGAIALILGGIIKSIFGVETPLVLLVGFLSWREGLLLGACFAVVHTLDELRTRAVSSHKLEDGA
jgi:fucose permease